MCGLLAVVSSTTLNSTQTKIFKDMLQMDVLRGKHSVGVIAADKTGVDHFKSVMNPTDFLEHRYTNDMMRSANVLVGHNRHATKGKVNSVNAHPFDHGHVTLVHNGTIDTFPRMPHQDAFDTDSECIAYNISLCKTDEDVLKFIETLEGAYALMWYDTIDDCLYVCRNNQRPLYYTTGKDSIYFASERGILFAALDRATLSLTGDRIGDPAKLEDIKEFPVGELWAIRYDKEIAIDTTSFTPKKKYIAPVTSYVGHNYNKSYTSATEYPSDLKKYTGMSVGTWTEGTVVNLVPSKNHKGDTVAMGADVWVEEGFTARIYNVKDLTVGDEVELTIDAMYLTMFENAKAKDLSEMTATSRNYRKIPPKSVILLEDKEVKPYRKCNNCDGFYKESEGYILSNHEFICDGCLSHDYNVRDYAANIGYA